MVDPLMLAIEVAIFAPAACMLAFSLRLLLFASQPGEGFISGVVRAGLFSSLLGSVAVAVLYVTEHPAGEVELGAWIRVGSYAVPVVFLIDQVAVVFSVLAAGLTLLVARFSRTYLHKEPGFVRFYVLLALFATGSQIVAFAGALDFFFAGWELIGVSSALYIGFFVERQEPVRSSLRAFATYRLCDVGFLLAVVATHELLGSTRLSVLAQATALPQWERNMLAALFLLAALGKSAQLPFSSWFPRAMEGPTPSSALFYGGVSIHAGLFLMLRIWPLLDAAPVIKVAGAAIGLSTALWASLVARVQTDAKGGLALATLAQIGLILAEISLGFTTLALVHLVGHALLRVWQYLRAPNTLHDTHSEGHAGPVKSQLEWLLPTRAVKRLFASAIHRFRLDDAIDAAAAPVMALARGLDRLDRLARRKLSLDREEAPP